MQSWQPAFSDTVVEVPLSGALPDDAPGKLDRARVEATEGTCAPYRHGREPTDPQSPLSSLRIEPEIPVQSCDQISVIVARRTSNSLGRIDPADGGT